MLLLPGILKPPAMLTVEANFAGGNLAATGLKALLLLSQNALSQNGYGYIYIYIYPSFCHSISLPQGVALLSPATTKPRLQIHMAMVKTIACHLARHDFTRSKGRHVKPHAIGMPEACP